MAVMTQTEAAGGHRKACPMCQDSGKVDGAYCTCGAGKRLQSADAVQKAEGE